VAGEGHPGDAGTQVVQAGEERSSRVESLRALAALSVLAGHVLAFTLALGEGLPNRVDLPEWQRLLYGGGFGVFFFFSLTGYLLFWPFAKRDYADGDRIELGRYARNRALRILPLYWAVVIVVFAFQQDVPADIWARFLLFGENFSRETAGQYIGTAWSLVVELCFYALLPLLALAVAAISRGRRRWAAIVIALLGLASLLLRAKTLLLPAAAPDPIWRFNLPATFLFFVPGMLLALLRLRWEEQRPRWLRPPLDRADLWLAASVPFWLLVVMVDYRLDPLLCVAAFLMIGACVLPLRAGPLVGTLQWKPLAVVGVASYSLYLWHVPVLDYLTEHSIPSASPGFLLLALVGVPAAIAVALLSYAVIESPFLRLRRQWSRSAADQTRA
jgi:peptidoglycan/LPS O-acetylase OafA/YrhL